MQSIIAESNQLIAAYVPKIVGAIAILLIGWLVALGVSSIIHTALKRTKLGDRIAGWLGDEETVKKAEMERRIARGFYYLILLFVLVGFFQALGLTLITEPLNRLLIQVFEYVPRLIGPAILLLVAWILATVLRFIMVRALSKTRIDERVNREMTKEGETPISLTKTFADVVYWLIFLLFLPAILNALALQGLLQPVQGMISKFLDFIPNIIAALLIFGVGWFVARIVQRIVTNLLVAMGTDRLGERMGLTAMMGAQRLSGLVGLGVYVLILIPVLLGALNALELDAITRPTSDMLNKMLGALPNIFGATLVLVLAYLVSRLVSGWTTNLLTGLGFNTVLARLGVGKEPAEGERTPSEMAGYLVLAAIMLFAVIEAFRLLGFALLAELTTQFTVFLAQVILGLILFAIGLFLANLAARAIRASQVAHSSLLAQIARLALLILAGAMALQLMGFAPEVISIAFGLLLGAVMLASALAFGLGGRETAGRLLQRWVESKQGGSPEK